jgi:hypothetical protein
MTTSPQSRAQLEQPEQPEQLEAFDNDGPFAAEYHDSLEQQSPVSETGSEDIWSSSDASDDLWQRDEPSGAQNPRTELTVLRTNRKGLSRGKLLWIAVGVVTGLAVLFRLLPPGAGAGQSAVDTTGAGRGQAQTQSPAPGIQTAPTPGVVQGEIPVTRTASGPLILLNPGLVQQGSSISVTGSGFGARTIIDLTVKQQGASTSLDSTFVQTDKNGAFSGATLTVPQALGAGNVVVDAQQRNSRNDAYAVGTVSGGTPKAKLGKEVGQPGDTIAVSLQGFAPGEPIKVFWNGLGGQPLTTLQADSSGGVGPAALQVPYGAVGNNTFLFVGANSQSVVAANFVVLALYPSVTLSSYAIQPDNVESFTGSGFGPNERVLIHLDNPNDPPVGIVQADSNGSFKNAGAVRIPFALQGQQTLIFIGEQSRAPDAVTFTILPYSPIVQPSTFGAFPGTTVSFFVSAFARNEVVHVYAGRSRSSMGTMVSCFLTDAHGSASGVGSYLIPGSAQAGPLGFALVGEKSGGVGLASVNVSAPPSPVQTPAQPAFTCPLDQHAAAPSPSPAPARSPSP